MKKERGEPLSLVKYTIDYPYYNTTNPEMQGLFKTFSAFSRRKPVKSSPIPTPKGETSCINSCHCHTDIRRTVAIPCDTVEAGYILPMAQPHRSTPSSNLVGANPRVPPRHYRQTEICRTVWCSQSRPYREEFQAMSKASNYAMSLRGYLWPWQSVSLKPSVLYQIPI